MLSAVLPEEDAEARLNKRLAPGRTGGGGRSDQEPWDARSSGAFAKHRSLRSILPRSAQNGLPQTVERGLALPQSAE